MQSSIRLVYIIPLFLLSCKCINPPCEDDPEPVVEYAYPPLEMLDFFDFPVGSWWKYKCLEDGSVDSLFVIESETTPIQYDRYGKGSYKGRRCQYGYLNRNLEFDLDVFTKIANPYGEVIKGKEVTHQFFSLRIASHDDRFNSQYCLYYPIEDINAAVGDSILHYQILDTTVQSIHYPKIYAFYDTWIASTLSNPIVEEWYVEGIGVVRYRLRNNLTYELIEHNITN